MKVLVACESSGVVREAFRRRGHDAWSCDLQPADDCSNFHIQADVRSLDNWQQWDLLIAHPDCTYLCRSGLHWNKRVRGREQKTRQAIEMVSWLMSLPVKRKAIENPPGRIGTAIRKADQYIQPYQFGHDAAKMTGLWLENLPLLVADPANFIAGRIVNGKSRWSNQTDSGQDKLPPGAERWKIRSRTYEGIAEAMAQQWSALHQPTR